MAVMLYRKGNTHKIFRDGVEVVCSARVFDLKHLQAAIHSGWCVDPLNITTKPGRKPPDPVPAPKEQPALVERGLPDATKG